MTAPVEKRSENVLLPEVSQPGMQISAKEQGEANNLHTQAVSGDGPVEHSVPLQVSFRFLYNPSLEIKYCA